MQHYTRMARGVVCTALVAGLTGCGGESLLVEPVVFDGAVVSADYIGETFPVFYLIGEAGDPTANTLAGTGSVTYNADGTLTLRLSGDAAITLTPTGSSGLGVTYEGLASGTTEISVLVSDFSSTEAYRLLSVAESDLSVLGGFGFETAVGDRPATATYATAGAVFLTADNVGAFLPAAGSGTLSANFTNGDISGTLIEADVVEVELAGAAGTPDELALTFMLENGVITDSGFEGDVGVTGELVVDGAGAPVALTTAVSGDGAEGTFYGDEAEVVSGIFGAEVELSDGSDSLVDLSTNGFLSGGKTGP